VQVVVWTRLFISLGLVPLSEISGSHGIHMLSAAKLFSTVLDHSTFPATMSNPVSVHSWQHITLSLFSDLAFWCVNSYNSLWFYFAFPSQLMILSIFSSPYLPSVDCPWWNVSPCLLFIFSWNFFGAGVGFVLFLCLTSSLCILDPSLWLNTWFADIFYFSLSFYPLKSKS